MPDLPDVRELLPHRGRYLLVDKLLALEEDRVEAVGHFTEEMVEGHFPGQPIVPGVLLLEALAQTMCCAHLSRPELHGGTPFLAGFEKVRFRAPVIPPATVHYRVTLKEERFGLFRATAEAWCNDVRVVSAKLMGAMMPPESAP